MTFTPINLLCSIEAMETASTSHLVRLAVNDTRAWSQLSSFACSEYFSQPGMECLPNRVLHPSPKVAVNGLPRRELMRKQAPGTASSNNIEDAVKHFA